MCSGNTFRSRLAEAYLKSLKIPGIEVVSSGANARFDHNHLITPVAALLLEKYGLTQYATKDKVQLTQSRLDAADITICLNRAVYSECTEQGLRLPLRTYIWDIADIKQFSEAAQKELDNNSIPVIASNTFNKLRQQVDELVSFLKRPKSMEAVDVLNEQGQPTGAVSDITTIHAHGWIHSGVHVGLYTSNGQVVLERRSSNIIFNPGLWDLSFGGVVRSAEEPEAAVIREASEELGIDLKRSSLQKLFVLNYDHYVPHYGFHNHNFTHTYIAQIPEHVNFTIQKSEVGEAKLFSISEAEKMNNANKNISGRMIPMHAYNQRILEAIKKELNLHT